MASDSPLPPQERLRRVDRLAAKAIGLWDLPPEARARLINVSENMTYLVEAPGGRRSILRVHRENHHARPAIESELAWAQALDRAGAVRTPRVIPGRDGEAIQQVMTPESPHPRHLVMFEFLPGRHPDPDEDLVAPFGELGEIAARAHVHARSWVRPEGFTRLVWNLETVFGAAPIWGDWRAAPNLTRGGREILERVEIRVTDRLTAFGQSESRYGLIHADMRLANLLIDGTSPRLIDFDDCGISWFLYDFAAGISFMEDHPQVPALKRAWLEGYRRVTPLPPEDEAEMESLIMLRRMALLAWIGSHLEAPEPQAMAPHFARVSAELGEIYLARS